MITEYVDDELPLPSFREIFGCDNSLDGDKGKKSAKRSNGSKDEISGAGRWTAEEHQLFLEGIMLYGKDWKKMQPLIKTRSLVQIRTHAQKVFANLGGMQQQKKETENEPQPTRQGTTATGVKNTRTSSQKPAKDDTTGRNGSNSGNKRKKKRQDSDPATVTATHPTNPLMTGVAVDSTTTAAAAAANLDIAGRLVANASIRNSIAQVTIGTNFGSSSNSNSNGSNGNSNGYPSRSTPYNTVPSGPVSNTGSSSSNSNGSNGSSSSSSSSFSGGINIVHSGIEGSAAGHSAVELSHHDIHSTSAVSAEDLELLQQMSQQMLQEEEEAAAAAAAAAASAKLPL